MSDRSINMNRFMRMFGASSLCCLTLIFGAGCGGGSEEAEPLTVAEPERFPELEAAEPLSFKELAGSDMLGVGAHSGEFYAANDNKPDSLSRARDNFSHVLYNVQAYDELTQQYGEYTYYSITGGDVRSPIDYLDNKSLAKPSLRLDALDAEASAALTAAGASEFSSKSVVIDFWRTNQEWFVRWDGLLDQDVNTVGIGPYGLARTEMRTEMLEAIESIAESYQPEFFVIGEDMEQLWLKGESGKLDAYNAEWFAFLSFYQEAVSRIRSVSPQTRVGAGINWDVFVNEVAPEYAKFEQLDETPEVDEELVDRAFRGILLPLAEWGDVLMLRSYQLPGDDYAWYYQFLRRLPDLYGEDIPVVWYDIGSPSDGSATAQRQRNYIDDFVTWNAGVNVEAVFWGRLFNIDGANGSNQSINGRCKSLVEDTDKNFLLERERCFDGLFDSLFSSKPGLLGIEDQLK